MRKNHNKTSKSAKNGGNPDIYRNEILEELAFKKSTKKFDFAVSTKLPPVKFLNLVK